MIKPSYFVRALVAGALLALAPRAGALEYVYNGGGVLWPPGRAAVLGNTTVVVSPTLTKPFELQTIVRRQGTITRSVLRLDPRRHLASWTSPAVASGRALHGTYRSRVTGFGSTIRVRLAGGNPAGAVTFRIQQGALTATGTLRFGGVGGVVRVHFVGIFAPPPTN